MLWTDEPISEFSQDTIGRREFAGVLVDLVERSHDPDSSIVIGLTGPWGSGKTSAFWLARSQLKESEWSVVELNPWAAADDDAMLAEFFSALASALPEKRGSTVRKRLATCAGLVGPALSAVPVGGGAASRYVEKLEKYLTTRKPWPAAFKDASDAFRSLGRRILVFVDDCDRLDPAELRTLLKVVRLIGRFPGITYVLAYDEETLARTLSVAGVGDTTALSAQRYLEKIVQFILPVPQLTASQVLGRLTGSLGLVLRECGWDPDVLSEYRLATAFEDVMLRRLSTPRSIDRFVAQARNLMAHLDPQEFDAVDLLVLLFARLQFPEGYAQLAHWRDTLCGSGLTDTDPWKPGSGTPVDWEPLLRHAGETPEDRRDFEFTLGAVFPAFQQGARPERGALRAADSLYFERHIIFEVPPEEVRDKDVSNALQQSRANPPDYAPLASLLSPGNPLHAVALQKLRRQTGEWGGSDVELDFVLHIADLRLALPDTAGNSQLGSSLLFWVSSLLPLLTGKTDPAIVVEALRGHLGDPLTAIVAKRVFGMHTAEWGELFVEAVTGMCVESAMKQLLDGDDAAVKSGIHTYVSFLRGVGRLDQLVALVKEALESKRLTLDGVAARCVNVVWSYNGGATQLDSVDTEVLHILTGTSEMPPPTTGERPDRTNLSWPNRREWARWELGPRGTTRTSGV